MIEVIVFVVLGLFVVFGILLCLAGLFILLTVFVGAPTAVLIRLFRGPPR